eukprot:CAMPEP_0198279984 /NCGR_PEP_ID=MMETSP1449-20131203/167_1 /TAXON_ID=420275 /ORGANISM="Attheya septentrionalis, Strain CCMP2084" /LENGTH=130 /DNA_ID=CAMNT_0043975241 /DNA_START=128 /DNA_END=518 /DNA_ORIENTATION=-
MPTFGTGTERATPASVSAKELAVVAEPKVPILLILILNFQRTPCGYRATYSDSNGSYDTDSSGDVDDEETKTRRATRGSMSTGRNEDVRLAVQASFLCHESSLTKGDMATVQRHAIDDIRILGEQEHLSV